MSIVDTPDHQQSTVSAQKLLAEGDDATQKLTVDIPPNAETLIVALSYGATSETITVTGGTSSILYSGGLIVGSPTSGFTETWVFDISAPVDDQVIVDLGVAPGARWYVYADSGVHIVTDLASRRDPSGSQFVVSIVPGTVPGYHPPDELQFTSSGPSASGDVVAAPGAGKRLRIFALTMCTTNAGLLGALGDGSTGYNLLFAFGTGMISLTIPLTGVVLSADASLKFTLGSGSGIMYCTAVYTVETI
ncbi:MAG: hypothetical protein ACRDLV_16130 [Solirubrobacteraceae bacterium]